ncbi:MAG: Gfo/Idh/MocA family protein [Planctomycetota bacterium]
MAAPRRARSRRAPARRAAPAALRIALLGQGFMGRAHANAWSQAGRFFETVRRPVLQVVAARDAATLARFAERWAFVRHSTDWHEAVAAPDVDLVDIGTPNHVHAPQGLAALAAGKHVAIEKPLAGTLDDARALHEAARAAARRGQQSFVWFNYRRCPAVALAWQIVREGRLGTLHHVRATYLQSWGGVGTPASWRFDKRLAGSGAHGDLNAHLVDLARFLSGEEIDVIHGATARTFVKQRTGPRRGAGVGRSGAARGGASVASTVDDTLLFLAGFAGGAVGSFEASRVATGHLNANTIELNGSRGSLRFDFESMNELWLHEAPAGRASARSRAAPLATAGWRRIVATDPSHPWVAHWWPEGHGLGYEHSFVNMAADILGALAGKAPPVPLPDIADAYQTQRVLEAALSAARKQRAVRLSEVR